MQAYSYEGMQGVWDSWIPRWRNGKSLSRLRNSVRDARNYNRKWPSHESREVLDMLLIYMIKFKASTVKHEHGCIWAVV